MTRPVSTKYLAALGVTLTFTALLTVPLPNPVYTPGPVRAATVDGGVPATWPCRHDVTWAFNPNAAPAGALPDLSDVFATYASLTGLTFHYQGTTTSLPQADDLATGSIGRRDADIVVAFAWPAGSGMTPTSSLLDNPDTGAAKTATATEFRDRLGVIRGPENSILAANIVVVPDVGTGVNYGGRSTVKAFLLHETGHAIGLDHAKASQQSIMTPTLDGSVTALTTTDAAAITGLYQQCLHTQ